MTEKQDYPMLRIALEYGPIILFFVAYTLLKDRTFTLAGTDYSGFVAVTAMFIPVLVLATLALWRITGHLSKMQIVTRVLVIGFGGLSIWLPGCWGSDCCAAKAILRP